MKTFLVALLNAILILPWFVLSTIFSIPYQNFRENFLSVASLLVVLPILVIVSPVIILKMIVDLLVT